MRLKSLYREIGVILFILLLCFFNLFYKGQEWMNNVYFFVLFLSFTLILLSIPVRTDLVKVGVFASLIVCLNKLLRMIGILEYNPITMKIHIPGLIMVYYIYTKLKKWLQ